jgi:hypothetical protein
MINLGNSSIKGIRLGNQRVSEMYLGETPITFTNGYDVGDYYPGAGGYVYWLDGVGGGQVALYQNVPSGSTSAGVTWGSTSQVLTGTLSDVTAGQANTSIMLANISQFSDRMVTALVSLNSSSVDQNAGFNDWYIPSIDALGYMYDNLISQNIATPWYNPTGSSRSQFMWSSTANVFGLQPGRFAWSYKMNDIGVTPHGPYEVSDKSDLLAFRAVRTFTSGSI